MERSFSEEAHAGIWTTIEIKTDWVLFLDADELINDAFCEEVKKAVTSGNHVGYWLNFHNWFQGKFLRHGDPFSKLALFDRPDAGRYERIDDEQWSGLDMEIHEHPVLDGSVGAISAPIDHNDRRGSIPTFESTTNIRRGRLDAIWP